MTDVWVANDEGTEIIRARDIAGASLDYDGNVTVRLTGADGAVVTIVGHRAHHEEHQPDDFHRQLIRVIAELPDAAGAFLVGAVHDRRVAGSGSASRCDGVVVPSAPGHRRHDGLDALGEADRVVVPGYFPLRDPSPPVLAALRSAAERGSRIASIGIGAFALAATGLLDGRAATTHWQEAGHSRARFPAVRLNPDVPYVDEGQLLTSAGLSAAIDLCLYMVRLDYGTGPATIQAPGPGPGARPGKR